MRLRDLNDIWGFWHHISQLVLQLAGPHMEYMNQRPIKDHSDFGPHHQKYHWLQFDIKGEMKTLMDSKGIEDFLPIALVDPFLL